MTNDIEMPILKRLRKSRGLLKEAAKKVGVTKSAMVRWDNMEIEPKPQYRQAYAGFLGISVAQLGSIIYEQSVVKSAKPKVRKARRARKATA